MEWSAGLPAPRSNLRLGRALVSGGGGTLYGDKAEMNLDHERYDLAKLVVRREGC